MRTTSKIIVLVTAVIGGICSVAIAQPQLGKMGFIRLVNAVSQGTGPLEIQVDGKSVNPKGYQLGDVTGGMGLKAGSHDITIVREGTKPGTTRVSVLNDDTTILIPFAERVPASDEEPAHWAIRILRLKVDIRDPEGKWTSVFVKRLAIAQAPILYPRGYVPLRSKDGDIQSIPVGEEGNYVVLLYDDLDGKVQSLNFQDQKFLSAD